MGSHDFRNSKKKPLGLLYVDTEKVWRGGQEQLLSLMIGMLDRGNRVYLAAPETALLSEKASAAGVKVLNFTQRNEFSILAFFKLVRILRTVSYDLIHFNTPRAIIAGGLVARILSQSIVFASRRVNFPLRSRLSALKYNYLTDRVLTVSSSIRDTLIDAGVVSKKVKVVYEGVDLKWIDSLQTTPVELHSKGVVVGTVAFLSHEKGHHSFLKAISVVNRQFPDARFIIIGDGNLRGELEELTQQLGITEAVVFTGFRTDSEALMKHFDIFCLPSLSEGLSSAIMAAMANRLPVVSTCVGGIPELVSDGETGCLVAPDSPEQLAKALSALIDSSELRARMGEAGRKRVEEFFTVENKLNQTERSYRELLQQK